MAMTIAEVREMSDNLNIASKLVANGTALLLNLDGAIVAVELYEEGRILDLMVINFVKCPPDSPHKNAFLAVLQEYNTRARCVRFAWRFWADPGQTPEPDAGVYLRTELFLMDGKITPPQYLEYLRGLVSWYFRSGPRLQKIAETGTDPGDAPMSSPGDSTAAGKTVDEPITKI